MRKLTPSEIELIKKLLSSRQADLTAFVSKAENYCVEDMNNGGMGSLLFISKHNKERRLGETLAEGEFMDIDEVPVMVSLNLDSDGNFYELDIWKTDFSPVIKLL